MTPHIRVVPATVAMVEAEIADPERLAALVGAELPPDWPPEHHSPSRLELTRDQLSKPGADGWWLHYVVAEDGAAPQLAGIAGYKGPPAGGVVEIGYSVVPSWQRRGIATAACRRLIDQAWERGAETVIAHTLPHLEPSIGVLAKLRFEPADPPEEGVLAFRLDRR
jgi:ribosomal-protein-alanine N-acetyltransferase